MSETLAGWLAWRMARAALLIWCAGTLVFLLLEVAPGPRLDLDARGRAGLNAERRLEQALGADRPLIERYARWIASLARGDFGLSWSHRQPVGALMGSALAASARLGAVAILLQFALGLGGGVLMAWRGGWVERILVTGAASIYSMPSYWIGLLLVWLVSVRWGLLPVSQMASLEAGSWAAGARLTDAIRHLALPAMALALPAGCGVALYARECVAGSLKRAWSRAARGRGRSEGGLLLQHGLRPSLKPVVTLFGMAIPGIVGGSVTVEVLFAWPGMGRLAYQATLARDEPLVAGCVCVITAAVVLGSVVADLGTRWADPRSSPETP